MKVNRKKAFRTKLGFTSQDATKDFFKAKDVYKVNWKLTESYTERIIEIFRKINCVVDSSFQLSQSEFELFKDNIYKAFNILKKYGVIEKKFRNQGRSPENVYFNWMRGYAVNMFFMKLIATVFQVDETEIEQLGKDNIEQLETDMNSDKFNREAIADLQISCKKIHVEVQAGFTEKNDIKWSKAEDAKKRYDAEGCRTFIVHFDLFNGSLAVIDITFLSVALPKENWEKNSRFESAITTPIPESCFKWNIEKVFPENPESIHSTVE